MHVNKISTESADTLLDPNNPSWDSVAEGIKIPLSPTPLAMQPTKGVRSAFENKPYGLIESATLQAVHDGNYVIFRVTWMDSEKDDKINDNDGFVDQMALMFPLTNNSVFITMGSELDPVELWRWRANADKPQQIRAKGIGTCNDVEDDELEAGAVWSEGKWRVVIKRKMETPSLNSANFIIGETQRCNLAVWAGHNQERAGIKSISMRWVPLLIS